MLNSVLPPWPLYTNDEINAVSEVLQSGQVNYWTGKQCRDFESEFADWSAVKHAICVANGTVALDLALYGLGVGEGDEVIVTPRTFLASASCVVNSRATPIFADVDLNTQALSAETIMPHINHKTKAIIVVHLAGMPADMDPIMELAREHKLLVIEDCAQAHGAVYKGKPVGGIGDVGAWSFCQDKIMTTGGEGGMVTTNNHALWEKMWSYKDHGKSMSAIENQASKKGFKWIHDSIGTNWRMTEMQAAIGRLQLIKMKEWTQIRNRNSEILTSALKSYDFIRIPECNYDSIHAFYKFYAFLIPEKMPVQVTRLDIMHALNNAGVPCFEGSCPEVYLEKAFSTIAYPAVRLENAKKLGQTSMMFLVHPTISEIDMYKIKHKIKTVLDDIILVKTAHN